METNDKTLTINERFSLMRQRLKLTKNAVGEAAGISGTTIGNIETGTTKNPSSEILAGVSKKLGVSLEWLIFGDGPMLKGQHPKGTGLISGEATVVESETLLKLAVTEAQLEAARQENARLYDLLGKSPSSPDAAGRWFAPLAPFGQRAVAAYAR